MNLLINKKKINSLFKNLKIVNLELVLNDKKNYRREIEKLSFIIRQFFKFDKTFALIRTHFYF